MQTQRPHCVTQDYGVKQIDIPYGVKQSPTQGLGIDFDTICNNHVDILRLGG